MAKRKKTTPGGVPAEQPPPAQMADKLADLFAKSLAMRNLCQFVMGMIGDPKECTEREDFPHHMRTLAGHTERIVRATSVFVRSMYTVRESADNLV